MRKIFFMSLILSILGLEAAFSSDSNNNDKKAKPLSRIQKASEAQKKRLEKEEEEKRRLNKEKYESYSSDAEKTQENSSTK